MFGIYSVPTPPRCILHITHGTKTTSRPADKPVINCLSTARCVPPSVYIPGHALHENGLQRLKSVGRLVSSQEERALLVPLINRSSTDYFVPAFGLHRISPVRASGDTFRRREFDALEGTRDPCLLGEQFCWHPVLPDPAPPPRRAPRPDPPVVCPGFGLDRWHFACSCFWGNVRATCIHCLGGYEGRLSPGRTVLSASSPARPRPAAPPCASTRSARGMSGFCPGFKLDMLFWVEQSAISSGRF